ncbi:MAG: S46 family peptidase [Salinivirgaceae bacterium]
MITRSLLLSIFTLMLVQATQAVEGMWLPIMLKKYTIQQMEEKGFKLTAEDLYSINQESIKDAVVGLVHISNPYHHFCSGQIISNQGLMLTNHHCGYDYIQSHSSLENDYLTNGFWAMNQQEELTNDDLGVCFLNRMEEVTLKVLENINENTDEFIRDSIIESNIMSIETQAYENGLYYAKVQPFFAGNEYYLSVYKIYTDVRLVGAPPSAIGKFGGDTDNWMWPRHTGDFSLFRIYADTNNNPADYSESNVPYKPAKVLDISMDGVNKGDFTMVLGYPGTTTQYLPSFAVTMQKNVINPAKIKIRTQSLNIIKAAMNADPKVRIQYASKAAGIANGWKKWMGENLGLERMNAIKKKQLLEESFQEWLVQNEVTKNEYNQILPQYNKLYAQLTPNLLSAVYFNETLFEVETVDLAGKFNAFDQFTKETEKEELDKTVQNIVALTEPFYKNYNFETDKKLFRAYIEFFYTNVPKEFHPEILKLIDTKFKGNIDDFTHYVYQKSMFPYPDKLNAFLTSFSLKKLKILHKDPMVIIYNQALAIYLQSLNPVLKVTNKQISNLHQKYLKGLREFQADKHFYPDANSTFRMAFGQIDNYIPMDAVTYSYQTTLEGIIEKDDPDIYDYNVPTRLKELYQKKEFGQYANPDSTMPVCFTASNHTTGGNSGSPVLNSKGQLIGINFDRNWEGTMSDIMYDPEMCRNIALDIRYILFIIDKFAGAGYLVNEMKLVNEPNQSQLPIQINVIVPQ